MDTEEQAVHQVPERSEAVTPADAWRVGLRVAAVAVVATLVVHELARLAGADFRVSTGGRPPMEVGVLLIVANVAVAVLVGTGLLALVAGKGPRAWRILAWVGLGFAVVSVAGPLGADGQTGTRLALATMHVVTGFVWWTTLRRRTGGAAR